MKFHIFHLRVNNSKVEKYKFTYQVSKSKQNFLFFNFELVTRMWKNKSLTIELVTW